MLRGGERRWGGLIEEEECEVEEREWSDAVIAAAANANPQPTDSVVLDETLGGRLMREYKSISVASDSSSSIDDDDEGMLINDDFDGSDDVDGGGEVRTKECAAASRAPPMRSWARSLTSPTARMTTTTTTTTRTEYPATLTAARG